MSVTEFSSKCIWEESDGKFTCIVCGVVRHRPLKRRCAGAKNVKTYSGARHKIASSGSNPSKYRSNNGLGSLTDRLLGSVGINESRYREIKSKFGLCPTCNCKKRKEWLNKVTRWMGSGSTVFTIWQYGVVATYERLGNCLQQTLESLEVGGFDAPLVFIDGPTDSANASIPINAVIRNYKTGHLINWMSALTQLYWTNTKADRYALFQDDLLCCSNLRRYLESFEIHPKTYWNLLLHDKWNGKLAKKNGTGWLLSDQYSRGALALVFDRQGVIDLLGSSKFINRPTASHRSKKSIDGMVCDVLKPQGYKEYIHNPSLVQHTGTKSLLGHNYGPVKTFPGEDWDPMQLLKDENTLPS